MSNRIKVLKLAIEDAKTRIAGSPDYEDYVAIQNKKIAEWEKELKELEK